MKIEKLFLVQMEVDDTLDDEDREDALSEIDLGALDIEEMIIEHFECRDISDKVTIDVHKAWIEDGELTYHVFQRC